MVWVWVGGIEMGEGGNVWGLLFMFEILEFLDGDFV